MTLFMVVMGFAAVCGATVFIAAVYDYGYKEAQGQLLNEDSLAYEEIYETVCCV